MLGRPDFRVQDPLLLEEIELYTELVIAATARSCPLTLPEIDGILGLRPARATSRPAGVVSPTYIDLRGVIEPRIPSSSGAA